jgi:hypothetical protein
MAATEQKLAREVNEEYHDPMDDWGNRDIFLSLVPLAVSLAFKDSALDTALNFGIAFSGFLLLLRLTMYDSREKLVWPILDATTLVSFAVLRGLMRLYDYQDAAPRTLQVRNLVVSLYARVQITKWWPLIILLIFTVVGIISLAWRRPFTAHYCRYPKFDRWGRGVWNGDAAWRRTNDIATLVWVCVWSIALLLTLAPIMTGHWMGYSALNVIFNYIVPLVLMAVALIVQQQLGASYRTTASRAASTAPAAQYPAGAEAMPTTTTTGASPV